MLNVLAHAQEALLADLDRVCAVVSEQGCINVTSEFCEIAEALNGAPNVLLDIFGSEKGAFTRTPIGAPAGHSVSQPRLRQSSG